MPTKIICNHANVSVINHYELIRKYKCADCDAIVMCDCDRTVGERLLGHQLTFTTDPSTQDKIKIKPIFLPNICNSCRGKPEDAHPKKAHHGSTSKVRRYYWREIHLESWMRYADWQEQQGIDPVKHFPMPGDVEFKRINDEVAKKWTKIHKSKPKYQYNDPSPAEVLKKYNIPTINIDGTYIKDAGKDKPLYYKGRRLSPEERAVEHYTDQGWSAMFSESIPFQALFGLLGWLWVQDYKDEKQRIVQFGNRDGVSGAIVTALPSDFGTQAHFSRRAKAFAEHLRFLGPTKDDMLWLFDYWKEPSEKLRQYLWAYKEEDLQRARQLVERIPHDKIIEIFTYLAQDYWDHYLGWPDLFLWKGDEYLFVEVKGSKDKLSAEQQRWISDNSQHLYLPFEHVKIHKKDVMEMSTTNSGKDQDNSEI